LDKALLDTDIFSEIRKRIDLRVLARSGTYLDLFGQYTISVITVLEVVKGWHKLQREDRVQEFLAEIATAEVLGLDRQGAELAGRCRLGTNRTANWFG
jgi:tRNA(fMet)-specific endonuclease VapC